MKSVVNATRLGDLQFFGRGTWSNERSLTAELGVVTYDDDDHYEVSSYTLGVRSDHLSNALSSVLGDEQPRESIHSPLDGDAELLLDRDTRAVFRRDGVAIDKAAEKQAQAELEAKRDRQRLKDAQELEAQTARVRAWRAANDGRVGHITPEEEADADALVA